MAQTQSLLAACGGDTVKLFDVSVERGDPCAFQHTPTPGLLVNCVRWNHTNLVIASAGEDRKISLWMKNGQSVGIMPELNTDTVEAADESILAICFSSKGSRYMCSGGSGKVVRVWDLQRKRCIKWLKGHVETITGVGYNCRDEQLASVSLSGDLILHNLASGTRAAELKDPNNQVLRVLEYSRVSRHMLVTAGDDGSVHLWDTTGRSPKMSWMKQHLAPTTGVCFSPSNDKLIVSVGLDKKLYAFDPGLKKPVHCVPCEAPFSSLAFRDDGGVLAAGTNSGRVVFYDVRGKLQPFTILRAYGPSEAVSSLSWQRSNPVAVNEANCTLDTALLGSVTTEDSVLMPDPLPATVPSTRGRSLTSASSLRNAGRGAEDGAGTAPGAVSGRSAVDGSRASQPWTNGGVTRLQTPRAAFGGDDDMEVFSPLVDVQPIMPSMLNSWDENYDFRRDVSSGDGPKKSSWGLKSPSGIRRLSNFEDLKDEPRSAQKDGTPGQISPSSPGTGRLMGLLARSPSATPPEAWGGDAPPDRGTFRAAPIQGHLISRFASSTPVQVANSGESAPPELDSLGTPAANSAAPWATFNGAQNSDLDLSSSRLALGLKHLSSASGSPTGFEGLRSVDPAGSFGNHRLMVSSRKLASGDKRLQPNSSQAKSPVAGDGVTTVNSLSPPPQSKDDRGKPNSAADLAKGSDISRETKADAGTSPRQLPLPVGQVSSISPLPEGHSQPETPSFALQLVQRALDESLGAVQQAIHEDVQNLHLELLRQFHIQHLEMTAAMKNMQDFQAELIEEVRHLRRENERLADL